MTTPETIIHAAMVYRERERAFCANVSGVTLVHVVDARRNLFALLDLVQFNPTQGSEGTAHNGTNMGHAKAAQTAVG
jgi:hypothetical protein